MKSVKNIVIVVGGLAALIVLLMWMQGLFTPGRIDPELLPDERAAVEDVQTVTAHYATMDQTAEEVGSIQSRTTTNIASKILATVESVNVRPGDTVKKDALLISLDDRDLRARREQSRNALQAAQAVFERATKDRQRYQNLLEKKSVTQTAFDDMQSAERIAKAKLEQASEQVRETDIMLSYAKIYAAAGGTVTDKFCDPGDLASPGKPLLTMYDPSNLRIEVPVRERLAGRLKIGDKVKVDIDAISKEVAGAVEEIMPSADPASRTVTVKVAIPREDGVFPGMFGRIHIPLDPVKFLIVPVKAVRKVGQLEMVTIKKEGKPITRAVRTGRRWNGDIEVLSGLAEGDELYIFDPEA